jgi:uncharacterized membrane-anchored protein
MLPRSVVALLAASFAAPLLAADEPKVQWLKGPTKVALGDQAEIALGADQSFAAAGDTQRIMERLGNSVSGNEVGLIVPQAEGEDWMLIFEYERVGFVKDDDKDKIDKNAILKSISEGTEQANARRKEMGIPALHVVGWFEEPHYDEKTHNLVWALRAKSDGGEEVINYNMRVLGRHGYMSVTLVDGPATLASSKVAADQLMKGFDYTVGRSYAEFRPGDKVAEYGLVALVAGGAGAAAAKLGFFAWLAKFFAKAGKAIVAALVAFGVAVRKWAARLFGREDTTSDRA